MDMIKFIVGRGLLNIAFAVLMLLLGYIELAKINILLGIYFAMLNK